MPQIMRVLAVAATCVVGLLSAPDAATAAVAHPVTLAQLESAPVPSLCGHAAGRLVKGALPGIAAGAGKVTLAATAAHHGSSVLAVGDLNGDGVPDAAAVVQCTTGSTSRPASIQLYTSGGKLLGGLSLDKFTHRPTDLVVKLTISKGTVFVHWTANQHGDPTCCPTLDYAVQLRLSAGKVVTSHAISYPEDRAADYLAGAGRLQSLKGAEAWATPKVAAEVLAADRRGTLGALFTCFGAPTRDKGWRGDTLDAIGAGTGYPAWLLTNERYCVAVTISPATWTVIRFKHVAWHHWQADVFVQAKATR